MGHTPPGGWRRDDNEQAAHRTTTVSGLLSSDLGPVRRRNAGRTGTGGVFLALALMLSAVSCGRSAPDEAAPDAVSVLEQTTSRADTTTTTTPPPPTQVTYIIQSGDSLSVIAERFGVPTALLAEFNAIGDVNSIKVGQEIRIPPADQATTSSEPTTTSTS